MTSTPTEGTQPEAGAETALPAEPVQTAAETPEPEAPSNEETQTPEVETPADDSEELSTWMQSNGIDPTDPEAVAKVAKIARDNQKAMRGKATEASELKKTLESQPAQQVSTDPLVQELYERQIAFERSTAISNFKRDVNLTSDQEAKVVQYIADNPIKAQLVNAGHMSLHDLYTLSGAGSADTSTIKAQGKQEALQQLANKQRATAVTGAAQKPGNTQPESDPILDILKGDD